MTQWASTNDWMIRMPEGLYTMSQYTDQFNALAANLNLGAIPLPFGNALTMTFGIAGTQDPGTLRIVWTNSGGLYLRSQPMFAHYYTLAQPGVSVGWHTFAGSTAYHWFSQWHSDPNYNVSTASGRSTIPPDNVAGIPFATAPYRQNAYQTIPLWGGGLGVSGGGFRNLAFVASGPGRWIIRRLRQYTHHRYECP